MSPVGGIMLRLCVRVFCGLFLGLSALISLKSFSADFGAGKYDVYLRSESGHEKPYIYLHGRERFVLIHGDVSVPLILPAGESYEIETVGEYSVDFNEFICCQINKNAYPVFPSYTSQEMENRNLQIQSENSTYYWADLDGDNKEELVIPYERKYRQSVYFLEETHQELIVVDPGATSEETPTVSVYTLHVENSNGVLENNISSMQNNGHSFFSSQTNFTIRDYDNDGRDELVVIGNGVIADTYYDLSFSGTNVTLTAQYNLELTSLNPVNLNGASSGNFRVNENGAATYSIPISLPAGTAGVAPSLSIDYSSQSGNGLLGYGFNLSGLSSITRCRHNIARDGKLRGIEWDNDDGLCLDGARLRLIEERENERVFKTDIDNYAIVTAYYSSTTTVPFEDKEPWKFHVENKDGSVAIYGDGNGNEEIILPSEMGGGMKIYNWLIKEQRDSVGNKIEYWYGLTSDLFGRKIDRIEYAFDGNDQASALVQFNYEDRYDVSVSYISGKRTVNDVRLSSIGVFNAEESFNGGALNEIRTYHFNYGKARASDSYKLSYIEAIQECVGSDCLPATYFDWSNKQSLAFEPEALWSKGTGANQDDQVISFFPMDINADGYSDIVYLERNRYEGKPINYHLHYMMFKPNLGEFDETFNPDLGESGEYEGQTSYVGSPDFGGAGGRYPGEQDFGDAVSNLNEGVYPQPIDYNADGRQDIAVFRDDWDTWLLFMAVPDGNGGWGLSGTHKRLKPESGHLSTLLDVNGDGLTDILTKDFVYFSRMRENLEGAGSDRVENSALIPEDKYNGKSKGNDEWDDTATKVSSNISWSETKISFESVSYQKNSKDRKVIEELAFLSSADFNGDGKADIIVADRQYAIERRWSLSYNFLNGGFSPSLDTFPTLFDLQEHYYIAIGDGLGNFEVTQYLGSEKSTNSGSGFESFTLNTSKSGRPRISPLVNIYAFDVNADGNDDILQQMGGTSFDYKFWLNDGLKLSEKDVYQSFVPSNANPKKTSVSFQDLDSDGFANAIVVTVGADSVQIYSFDPEEETFEYDREIFGSGTSSDDNRKYQFLDADGDSRIDMIEYNHRKFGLQANLEKSPMNVVTAITNGLGAVTEITYEPLIQSNHYSSPGQNPDLLYSYLNEPFEYLSAEQTLSQVQNAPVLDYISNVLVVTGVSGDAPVGEERGDNYAYPQQGNVDASNRAEKQYYYSKGLIQAGGVGFLGFRELTTTDDYSDISVKTTYRQDWPFVGYPMETRSELINRGTLNITTNEWRINNWNPDWLDDYSDITEFNSGRGYEELGILQPYLAKSTEKQNKYKNSTRRWISPIYSSSSVQSVRSTSVTENEYDDWGNIVKSTTTLSGDGLSQIKVIENDYDNDGNFETHGAGPNIYFNDERLRGYAEFGRLTHTRATTTQNNETRVRNSEYEYFPSGVHAGLLQREIANPDQLDFRVTTEYVYNSFGAKVRSSTTARNHVFNPDGSEQSSNDQTRIQEFEYDSSGRYANITRNVMSDTLFYEVERVTARNEYGAPTRIESSMNDLVTSIQYDVLGREIYRQDNADSINNDGTGAWARTEYLTCADVSYCPVDINGNNYTSYVVQKTAADESMSLQYFDRLGRVIRSATLGFDGDTLVFVDTEYNQNGQVMNVSEPYYEGTAPEYWTSTYYSRVGDPYEMVMPDGSVTKFSHNGNVKTTTNALGQIKIETSNALGQLVSVADDIGGRIVYKYKDMGELETTTVHPTGMETTEYYGGLKPVTITLDYDNFGRKISMDDPSKGFWEYKYNAFGELVWQRDAKGQVNIQKYDTLGRMISRTDYFSPSDSRYAGANDGVEQHTRWYYDGTTDGDPIAYAGNGVSAIVMTNNASVESCTITAESSALQCQYPTYDNFGRTESTLTVNNVRGSLESYTTSVAYDAIGRVEFAYDATDGLLADASGSKTSGIQNVYENGYLKSVTDLYLGRTIFSIENMNARGQVTDSTLGALDQNFAYNSATGQIESQTASAGALIGAQNIAYKWDAIGNLLYRHNQSANGVDGNNQTTYRNQREAFCYDSLNRLTRSVPGTTSVSATDCSNVNLQDTTYYSNGNIKTSKSGGDNISYQYYSDSPYALRRFNAATNQGYTDFFYDANGNVTHDRHLWDQALYRDYKYSTFDKPYEITKGTGTANQYTAKFSYGIDRGRFVREDIYADGRNILTHYMGGVEKVVEGNTIKWKRYLGKSVVHTVETSTTPNASGLYVETSSEEVYILRDHLGSTDVITDADGTVLQSMSFNPWGQRRDPEAWTQEDVLYHISTTDVSLTELREYTTKGYTGHEMLDELGLIHMNGRIYDPRIARFLQADPFIQATTQTQSFNRYAYLWNNPLNATDPSGFLRSEHFKQIAVTAFAITATILAPQSAKIWVAVLTSAFAAKFNGGSDRQVLLAAVTAAFTAGASVGIEKWYHVLHNAVVGGIASGIQGGEFGHGFLAAGAASSLGYGKFGSWLEKSASAVTRIGIRAVVGGTVSKLTGGKFENGAATAAFQAAVSEGVGAVSEHYKTKYDEHGPIPDNIDMENINVERAKDLGLTVDGNTIKGEIELVCMKLQGGCNRFRDVANKEWNGKTVGKYKLEIEFKLVRIDEAGRSSINVYFEETEDSASYNPGTRSCIFGFACSRNDEFVFSHVYAMKNYKVGDLFTRIVNHEIGHAIGFYHFDNDSASFMSYNVAARIRPSEAEIGMFVNKLGD